MVGFNLFSCFLESRQKYRTPRKGSVSGFGRTSMLDVGWWCFLLLCSGLGRRNRSNVEKNSALIQTHMVTWSFHNFPITSMTPPLLFAHWRPGVGCHLGGRSHITDTPPPPLTTACIFPLLRAISYRQERIFSDHRSSREAIYSKSSP